MSFAERMMKNMGWQEGDGLGKKRDGVRRHISVAFKNDQKGVGHTSTEWSDSWWDAAYNRTSAHIVVAKTEDGEVNISKAAHNSTSAAAALKTRMYSSFVSASSETSEEKNWSVKVSDEELLKACEGRTARKGARGVLGGSPGGDAKLLRTGEVHLLAAKQRNLSQSAIPMEEGDEIVEDVSFEDKGNKLDKEKTKKKRKGKREVEDIEDSTQSIDDSAIVPDIEESKKKRKNSPLSGDGSDVVEPPTPEEGKKKKKKKKSKREAGDAAIGVEDSHVDGEVEKPQNKKKSKRRTTNEDAGDDEVDVTKDLDEGTAGTKPKKRKTKQ
ncbi:hypothetical protein BJ742DRAFT_48334 [Cladochytrium replicatum]|nr:hypothetical protein BJ742DRAFT_48334 [Cladochytrium replicatum]